MPDETLAERIRMLAEAARIPLGAETPARIARAVTPALTRIAAENLAMPLEVEPSTFVVVQHREVRR